MRRRRADNQVKSDETRSCEKLVAAIMAGLFSVAVINAAYAGDAKTDDKKEDMKKKDKKDEKK